MAVMLLANGAAATDAKITPGVGIGKVKLGMTLAEAKRALRGSFVLSSERGKLSGGRRYVEYTWNYSEYRVGFVGGKTLRAVIVSTYLQAQRINGVGVGTERGVVKQKLGAVACRSAQNLPGGGGRYVRVRPEFDVTSVPVCVFARSGQRVTVFWFVGEDCHPVTPLDPVRKCDRYVVKEVLVTGPYQSGSV